MTKFVTQATVYIYLAVILVLTYWGVRTCSSDEWSRN